MSKLNLALPTPKLPLVLSLSGSQISYVVLASSFSGHFITIVIAAGDFWFAWLCVEPRTFLADLK